MFHISLAHKKCGISRNKYILNTVPTYLINKNHAKTSSPIFNLHKSDFFRPSPGYKIFKILLIGTLSNQRMIIMSHTVQSEKY